MSGFHQIDSFSTSHVPLASRLVRAMVRDPAIFARKKIFIILLAGFSWPVLRCFPSLVTDKYLCTNVRWPPSPRAQGCAHSFAVLAGKPVFEDGERPEVEKLGGSGDSTSGGSSVVEGAPASTSSTGTSTASPPPDDSNASSSSAQPQSASLTASPRVSPRPYDVLSVADAKERISALMFAARDRAADLASVGLRFDCPDDSIISSNDE